MQPAIIKSIIFKLKNLKLKNKKLGAGIGIAVIIFAAGLFFFSGDSGASAEVVKAARQDIEEYVLANGRIEVPSRQDFVARSSGLVEAVLVRPGDRVKAGQVLLRLEDDEPVMNLRQEEASLAARRAELAKAGAAARPEEVRKARAGLRTAEEAYKSAKQKYERSLYLFNEGAVSMETLEEDRLNMVTKEAGYRSAEEDLNIHLAGESDETIKALEAQVRQAEVAVEAAREELAGLEVTASADGVVLSLDVEAGDYITTGSPLVTVGNPSDLEIKAQVNEADSGSLRPGQKVIITCPALPGEEFAGVVELVALGAVTSTGTQGQETRVDVIIRVTEADEKLKPGYTADLEITTATAENALVIPYESIIQRDSGKEVMVVENGRVKTRQIETGIGNELYIVVTEGLKEGEKLVKNPGGGQLTDGMEITEVTGENQGKAEAKKQ